MIISTSDAGLGLKLWSGKPAIERGDWEIALAVQLGEAGFQQVYTPYIAKNTLRESYDLKLPKTLQADVEGDKYNYLGHKGLNHGVMFKVGQISYTDLPRKIFEFAEVYSLKDHPSNHAGLYLSIMSKHDDKDELAGSIYALIQRAATSVMMLKTYSLRIAQLDWLEYMDSDGSKKAASLILGCASYEHQSCFAA